MYKNFLGEQIFIRMVKTCPKNERRNKMIWYFLAQNNNTPCELRECQMITYETPLDHWWLFMEKIIISHQPVPFKNLPDLNDCIIKKIYLIFSNKRQLCFFLGKVGKCSGSNGYLYFLVPSGRDVINCTTTRDMNETAQATVCPGSSDPT